METLQNYPQERQPIKALDFSDETARIQSNFDELDNYSITQKTGAGAVPVTHKTVELITTGENALTLEDGEDGQELTILMTVSTSTGTLTPANFANGSTIAFNAVGNCITLIFANSNWHVKNNYSCSIT